MPSATVGSSDLTGQGAHHSHHSHHHHHDQAVRDGAIGAGVAGAGIAGAHESRVERAEDRLENRGTSGAVDSTGTIGVVGSTGAPGSTGLAGAPGSTGVAGESRLDRAEDKLEHRGTGAPGAVGTSGVTQSGTGGVDGHSHIDESGVRWIKDESGHNFDATNSTAPGAAVSLSFLKK